MAYPTYHELLNLAMSRQHIHDDQLFVTAEGWILVQPPFWHAEGRLRMYNQAAARWRAQYGTASQLFWFLKPIAKVRRQKEQHGRHAHGSDLPRRYHPFPGPIYVASRGTRITARVADIRVEEADRHMPIATGMLQMIQSTQYGLRGSAGVLLWH